MSIALDIVYAAGAVLTSPVWAYSLLRSGKWRTDWPGRFGRGELIATGHGRTLLIHAVSVGEVNAIRGLVNRLSSTNPDLRLVIAVTTNTGHDRAVALFAQDHTVVRYPLDFSGPVRRFLDRVRPDAVALVELEVWPNFIAQCAGRGIPVCVINGRLSERSFKRYRVIKPVIRPTFARLAAAAVQTPQYAERFGALGVPPGRVHVLDTMKWDSVQIVDQVDGAEELATDMGIDRDRPLIVAGSTGPGEEQLLMETCPADAQLLLAPRRPERFERVAALAPDMVRRTRVRGGRAAGARKTRLFLLDTIGDLPRAYALADLVVVGRSFLGLYGSDVMEPIALGKPTMIGPFHADFAEVVSALRIAGGIEVTDRPGKLVAELLLDRDRSARLAEAGRRVIRSRQGATDRHLDLLLGLIPERVAPIRKSA